MNSFTKTIFKGLLILVPIIALLYLLNQLYNQVSKIVTIAIEKTRLETEEQVYIIVLFSIIIILVVSYLLGTITKTKGFKKISKWVDAQLIDNIKVYRNFKLNFDNNIQFLLEEKPPIFVTFNNYERPGFLIETKENKSIVFIPKNIHTHDGNIFIVESKNVRLAKNTKEEFRYNFDRLGNDLDIS